MNDPLKSLIRQAVELEALSRSAVEPLRPGLYRRPLWALTGVAAAIGLLAVMFPRPPAESTRAGMSAAAVSVDYQAPADDSAVGMILPCTRRPAVALVLFRVWDGECQCISWRVHRGPDGAIVVQLYPDEAVAIPLDVSEAPPVEQAVLLAVASAEDELPVSKVDRERLLACLNGVCPPVLPGDRPLENPTDVLPCLPDNVTLVSRSFVAQ